MGAFLGAAVVLAVMGEVWLAAQAARAAVVAGAVPEPGETDARTREEAEGLPMATLPRQEAREVRAL